MADHLLEVRNLSVDFFTAAGVVHAVRNISYHLDRGETLAILGESGSGKSVSSSAIMNLIDMPPGHISSGEILLDGVDLLTMPAGERREINGRRIAMIFQDPLSHLNPVYTVGWQIREAMTTHGRAAAEAEAEALRLLGRVGLPEPERAMQKYPHEFSGGQRQRVMIAMALALRPDLLIADEPTTALDVTVQSEVLALLKELQRETGMAVLIITHDLGVVAEIADRVVVMEKGVLVESGMVREVYKNPSHAYTRKLIAAAPGKGEMHRPLANAEPLLVVRDVRKRYGAFDALKGVSFNLAAGETLAIVGESGSGKSTLARMLLRLDEPDAGSAHWKGRDLFQLSPAELYKLRRELQMVFQDPTQSLNPRMTVFQLISEAWAIHPDILPKAKWRERVAELLLQVGLSAEHMSRYPHQFSGGQRQRIAIARALALEPQLIVCDEAVSALDVSVQAQVIALLDKLRREMGISFIFIAHDLPVVRDFADHVMVMQKGEVVEMGTVQQVFDAPREAYTKALFAASLDPDPDVQAAHRAARLERASKDLVVPPLEFPMSKSAFVALVTCFNEDETINYEATRAQVRRQVAAGNNIMCAGTNGDFTALTFEEKVRLTEEVVDEVKGRARVIVNAGMPATFETVKLAREFDRIGVDGIAVITPFFIACTQDGLIRHFSSVADAVQTPVYLYDIPARTQNHIEPETAAKLARHGNIAGIKDSGGAQQTLEAYLQVSKDNPGFEVYSGPDHLVLWALQNGAAGCISGLGNAMPDVLAAIIKAFNEGNVAEAERQQARFTAFRTDLYALGFAPAMVKRALYLQDASVGASRQPALLPNEEQDRQIRMLLSKHGIV